MTGIRINYQLFYLYRTTKLLTFMPGQEIQGRKEMNESSGKKKQWLNLFSGLDEQQGKDKYYRNRNLGKHNKRSASGTDG